VCGKFLHSYFREKVAGGWVEDDVAVAIAREKQIKSMLRIKKIELIKTPRGRAATLRFFIPIGI
jgi:predicted GIY-YIG superfamily endonuclease